MSLRSRLTNPTIPLTRSDERVIRALLSDYPAAGLGTTASLARLAGVSDPTVTRLLAKLGFESFTAFHKTLLEEVDARMHSPLLLMGEKLSTKEDQKPPVQRYFRSVNKSLERTAMVTPLRSFDVAVKLILEAKGVYLVGGRFSRHLAGMLAGYLSQIRPRVFDLGTLTIESFDKLVDLGKRDTLIVFDYRRYQTDVVNFTKHAAAHGAKVILFTDPFQSPLATLAQAVLVAEIEVESPYDSMSAALAQAEALAAQIVSIQGNAARDRIGRIESVRNLNSATIDARNLPSSRRSVSRSAAGAKRGTTRLSRLRRNGK